MPDSIAPDTPPEIRRAAERFCTHVEAEGKKTWHSFSFGNHYDPARINFGPIMAINEERLAPGAGYEPHKHAGVDILTWVLTGTLAHEDSTGFGGNITPGTLQHLNAGAGVTHSEVNASDTEPLVFVQMMVRAIEGSTPRYGSLEIPTEPGLHAGPELDANARVFVLKVNSANPIDIDAVGAHLILVTSGNVVINGAAMAQGDQWESLAGGTVRVESAQASEAIVWLID